LDLRIVITWDADRTDVELLIEHPDGEKCDSFHNFSSTGGILSRNFTQGYGPQEYLLRRAQYGEYKIFVKLNSSINAGVSDAVTIKMNGWTHFGHASLEKEFISVCRIPFSEHKKPIHMATIAFSEALPQVVTWRD